MKTDIEKKTEFIQKSKNNYEAFHKEVGNWPSWKVEAYNNSFAVSKHAKKLELVGSKA